MAPTVAPSVYDTLQITQDKTSIRLDYEDVPGLITALRRAYNTRPSQSQADGVVASVLLQSAVAEAPGDFS